MFPEWQVCDCVIPHFFIEQHWHVCFPPLNILQGDQEFDSLYHNF
jgi:hypothetical protein